MRKFLPAIMGLLLAVLCGAPAARAQGSGVKNGPDPSVVRDPAQERDSIKNLEAAKLYFNMRKAYRAALDRCEEIIAGDPNFSRVDEALWFAGMSNLYLAQGKGKQEAKLKPEEYLAQARHYLTQLVNEHPDSKFRKKAEDELTKLGPEKPEEKKQ